MIGWGWRPEGSDGIWRHGAAWMRPLVVSAPYLTVMLLVLMLHVAGNALTVSKGVLFELPDGDGMSGESTEMVAIAMPLQHDTVVFFDDARYILGDTASERSLVGHLSDRVGKSRTKTLLLMADGRVPGARLMRFADLARKGGVGRLLFAEKGPGGQE